MLQIFTKFVFLNISNYMKTKFFISTRNCDNILSCQSVEILVLVIYCVAKLQLDQDGVKTGLVLQPYSQSVVTNSHPGHLQFYDIEQNKLWLEVCGDENSSRTLPWTNSIICVSVCLSVRLSGLCKLWL